MRPPLHPDAQQADGYREPVVGELTVVEGAEALTRAYTSLAEQRANERIIRKALQDRTAKPAPSYRYCHLCRRSHE